MKEHQYSKTHETVKRLERHGLRFSDDGSEWHRRVTEVAIEQASIEEQFLEFDQWDAHENELVAAPKVNAVIRLRERYAEEFAAGYLANALEIAEQACRQSDHPTTTFQALNDRAEVLCELGKCVQAHEAIELANMCVKEAEPSRLEMARMLDNSASLLFYQGSYSRSLKLYIRAYDYRRSALPEDSWPIAESLFKLGRALHRLSHVTAAEQAYHQSLAIGEKRLHRGHIEIAKRHIAIGVINSRLGRLTKAEQCIDHGLSIVANHENPDHPVMAEGLLQSGNMQLSRTHPDAAKESFARALSIRQSVYGATHLGISPCLWGLGCVAHAQGDADLATTYFRRARMIVTAISEHHPDLLVMERATIPG